MIPMRLKGPTPGEVAKENAKFSRRPDDIKEDADWLARAISGAKVDLPSVKLDDEAIFNTADPAKYLKAFWRMSRRRDRYRIGFDRHTLAWVAKMWGLAAVAALGNDAVVHEANRYKRLLSDLETGMKERQEDGVVFLDSPTDWPSPQTILAALRGFANAQMAVVQ
jgi:hypothetical protein